MTVVRKSVLLCIVPALMAASCGSDVGSNNAQHPGYSSTTADTTATPKATEFAPVSLALGADGYALAGVGSGAGNILAYELRGASALSNAVYRKTGSVIAVVSARFANAGDLAHAQRAVIAWAEQRGMRDPQLAANGFFMGEPARLPTVQRDFLGWRTGNSLNVALRTTTGKSPDTDSATLLRTLSG